MDYGPVLPELVWEGQQAIRLVCLEKKEEPLVRPRPLYLPGAADTGSGCVMLSMKNRDAGGGGAEGGGLGATRHRWNCLLQAGGAWPGEKLSQATPLFNPRGGGGGGKMPHHFLLQQQVIGSSCLQPTGGQLSRRGLHQSAPSVYSPAPCNGKKRRRRRKRPSSVI